MSSWHMPEVNYREIISIPGGQCLEQNLQRKIILWRLVCFIKNTSTFRTLRPICVDVNFWVANIKGNPWNSWTLRITPLYRICVELTWLVSEALTCLEEEEFGFIGQGWTSAGCEARGYLLDVDFLAIWSIHCTSGAMGQNTNSNAVKLAVIFLWKVTTDILDLLTCSIFRNIHLEMQVFTKNIL